MTQKAIQPATLRGSEQAEYQNLAWKQTEVLNIRSQGNFQPRFALSYVLDEQLNVIHLQFSPLAKWGNLS